MKLTPCPFCGSPEGDSGPTIREHNRHDRMTFNKAGKPYKRVNISHSVECTYCGAEGPHSLTNMGWHDEPELTDVMVERSASAAAMVWNTRQKTHDRVYDLVNRLIADAFTKIEQK